MVRFRIGKNKRRIIAPKDSRSGKEYLVVSQSQILAGGLESVRVRVSGIVSSKPLVVTRLPPPVFGGGGHDHYTVFKLDSGVTVGFPGIALVSEGEEVTVYGVVREGGQVIADKIVGEKAEFEIQS